MDSYKKAGVDKVEGYKTVDKIKEAVSKTHNANVLNNIGSFGAFYELKNYRQPVLVSGTDGVGTKLSVAIETKKFDTIGQDCFAMCANDILCHGAKPLFFLDYLACGKLDSDVASTIVKGIADACLETKCALIGGETAEMPGMYKVGDYDVAGFCVGAVEKDEIIDGSKIAAGDTIISISSSGFHSNGYSLVRKIFTDYSEVFDGKKMSDILLEPTKLYQNCVLKILEKFSIHGMAHITGGGLIENVPRILPKNLSATIEKNKIAVPRIMQELMKRGSIPSNDMWGTFNMGVGFVLVVSNDIANSVVKELGNIGERATIIGEIKDGSGKLTLV